MTVTAAVVPSSRPRMVERMDGFSAGAACFCFFQISGSSTRVWIQKTRRAGATPMKKTARQPSQG